MNTDRFNRIAEMLKSIDEDFDPESSVGRAEVTLALIGHFNPPLDMLAICECGWRGTMRDCREFPYNNGASNWAKLSGRAGVHYHCPQCIDRVVWKYYYAMN